MRAICVALLALGMLLTADAQAAGRRRLAREARSKYDQAVSADVVHRPAPLDPRAVYPKYQGGFHSRALENIGVPTGDIGIRGNGFMMSPW